MFRFTDTGWAPWYVANNNDKKRGRLNIISHILSQIPYEPVQSTDITLPKRQKAHGYQTPKTNRCTGFRPGIDDRQGKDVRS